MTIGGLNSYSTVLLLVAYINCYGLKNARDLTPSRLLLGFLDFYGNHFSPNILGVAPANNGYRLRLSNSLIYV